VCLLGVAPNALTKQFLSEELVWQEWDSWGQNKDVQLDFSVFGNLVLNINDVLLVKLGNDTILNAHVLFELLLVEGKGSQDLKGGRGDTSLVGGRVAEYGDTGLLETETSILGEEQVGSLDNVLENRDTINEKPNKKGIS
jgi:hypothetical protein